MKNKFKNLRKQIILNKYLYRFIIGKKGIVMKYYKKMQGYSYDINNSITFTEKINSRKLDNNPLFSLCADKIKVRDYVKEKIGEKYLIPSYFTTNKINNKIYKKIPKQCVLKTASGSGTLKIIYDKDKETKNDIIKTMKYYQKIDFAYIWGEMFY